MRTTTAHRRRSVWRTEGPTSSLGGGIRCGGACHSSTTSGAAAVRETPAEDLLRDAGRFLDSGIIDNDDDESIAVLERAVLTQAFAYAVNSRVAGLCGTTLGAAVRTVAGRSDGGRASQLVGSVGTAQGVAGGARTLGGGQRSPLGARMRGRERLRGSVRGGERGQAQGFWAVVSSCGRTGTACRNMQTTTVHAASTRDAAPTRRARCWRRAE